MMKSIKLSALPVSEVGLCASPAGTVPSCFCPFPWQAGCTSPASPAPPGNALIPASGLLRHWLVLLASPFCTQVLQRDGKTTPHLFRSYIVLEIIVPVQTDDAVHKVKAFYLFWVILKDFSRCLFWGILFLGRN